MDHTYRLARIGALMGLVASLGLAGCGGNDDAPTPAPPPPAPTPAPTPPPPPPPPPPAPTPTPDTAFATPADAADTAEGGDVVSYTFAATGSDQVASSVAYASGTETFSATLAAPQSFAGAALRLYAPGNTASGTAAPIDASGFSKLRIHLASTTDATLTIKLQPAPVAADGCAPTAQALVSASVSEFVIDLNDATFTLPSYCAASATTLHQRLAGLYAVDVINDATGAGAHDLVVGAISLVP